MSGSLQAPIQKLPLPDTAGILLEECREAFVDLYAYSGGKILVDMRYHRAGLPFAPSGAYVRRSVAEKLMAAKELLPRGYTFVLWDAWRPYEVQKALFDRYRSQVERDCPPGTPEEEILIKTREFVSLPEKGKKLSFVHSSGGAVDLTLADDKGNCLDMGTDFDDFSPLAHTHWFEASQADPTVRENRRLLRNALCSCGFTNYPAEWWHYDYGDAFWAFYKNQKAIYPSVYKEKEVMDL